MSPFDIPRQSVAPAARPPVVAFEKTCAAMSWSTKSRPVPKSPWPRTTPRACTAPVFAIAEHGTAIVKGGFVKVCPSQTGLPAASVLRYASSLLCVIGSLPRQSYRRSRSSILRINLPGWMRWI